MNSLWLDHSRQDIRYAARGLIRERRFTLSALAALVIAIGAATAVFSVADRSLIRPLPYAQGDRLVSVSLSIPAFGSGPVMFSGAFNDWRRAQNALDLTIWAPPLPCDVEGNSPERLSCMRAEAAFLPTLGVHPVLGRNFSPDQDRPWGQPVVIITSRIWRTRFGEDPRVVGRSLIIDGAPTRIIGVLPENFESPDLNPVDLLLPQRLPTGPRNIQVAMLGRLRDGFTGASVAVALTGPFERFRSDFGSRVGAEFAKGMSLHVDMLREQQTRQYRLALWMLLGAVGAFVLIACANVANLLLARSSGRRQEFAIRAALGSPRYRFIAQLLTESGLLALVGAVFGCLLAWSLLRAFVALAPDGMLRLREASLDPRVLIFALLLSLGTALTFGLAPLIDGPLVDVMRGLRTSTRHRTWLRQILIVSQLAVSLMLLSASGLLLRSLWRLENVPLGFRSERIVTATMTLPAYRYSESQRQINFMNDLDARLRDLREAVATAVSDSIPPGTGYRSAPMARFTKRIQDPSDSGSVKWRYVSVKYFQALGIPILRGRSFEEADQQPGVRNVIVNESLARRLAGDADPIGQRLGENTIVGLAADVRNNGLDRSADPEFYQIRKPTREGIAGSSDPAWFRRAAVIFRSNLNDRVAEALLRQTVRQIDPVIPVKIQTMQEEVDRFLTRPRFQTTLLAMFAVTGLLLAGIGLYGLMSFLVAQRTREIGVRIALGATPTAVGKLVVAEGMRWTVIGVAAGIVASAVSMRLLKDLLYEVNAFDLRAFAAAAVVVITVALGAAWLPAHRASKVDPMIALRDE